MLVNHRCYLTNETLGSDTVRNSTASRRPAEPGFVRRVARTADLLLDLPSLHSLTQRLGRARNHHQVETGAHSRGVRASLRALPTLRASALPLSSDTHRSSPSTSRMLHRPTHVTWLVSSSTISEETRSTIEANSSTPADSGSLTQCIKNLQRPRTHSLSTRRSARSSPLTVKDNSTHQCADLTFSPRRRLSSAVSRR